ncbi:MAG: o-succinylbenzoate--CoA ligase [Candidatus Kryptoniota bacterium]
MPSSIFSNSSYENFRVFYDGQIISGGNLMERVAATAGSLASSGLHRNDIAGILSDNSLEFVIAVLALWQIGAVPMPISTRLTDNEISKVLSSVSCSVLLTDSQNGSRSILNKIRSFTFADLTYEKAKRVMEMSDRSYDETALVILTSGSTATPKGVRLTFKNLVYSALASDQFFNHKKDDKWLASLPFYHIGGFSVITRSLLFGTELIIPSDLSQDAILYSIGEYHPSFASFVPTQLKRILEKGGTSHQSLRKILLGGGFIDSNLVRSAIEAGWPVAKSYGSSETASFITVLPPENFNNKPESAGKPLEGNKIFIVDEKEKLLAANEPGEIAVESPAVAGGYINDELLTLSRFRKGIYYTGDYGYMDGDGYLYVLARKDEFIISGGEKINPREVEIAILNHPQVEDAAVLALNDSEWGQIVAAVVVPRGQAEITISDLRRFLKNRLASYKHPKKLFTVSSIPRTPLGKVKLGELQEIVREINNSSPF